MKPILEYIISKSTKRYVIKATDDTIRQIVKDEIDHLGKNANLNHIDVSKCTNFSDCFKTTYIKGLFYNTGFYGDISEWNVSNIKNMSSMFFGCEEFNCDISNWYVSNVTKMDHMFHDCIKFNQDLSKWDVSNVTNMEGMFKLCENFNQPIGNWNVSKVENMDEMFYDCKSFNQDLSNWNIKKANLNTWMFNKKCIIYEIYMPKYSKRETKA